MTKDMTQGNPISLILKFSIPLILGNLFQQLYNMVDTIIVGRALGLNSLTAVAATTSLNFLIVGFVLGVCSGLAIPVAQRFGAGDYKKMRKLRRRICSRQKNCEILQQEVLPWKQKRKKA